MKAYLTYIGRRIGLDGKSRQVFLLRGKTEFPWRGISGLVIGMLYEAEHTGKTWTMSKRPKTKGRSELWETHHQEWYAHDLIAEQESRAKLEHRKAQKFNSIIQKMEPLKPLFEKLSFSEKRALLEYFLDKFTITHRPSTLSLRRENLDLRRYARRLQKAVRHATKEKKK